MATQKFASAITALLIAAPCFADSSLSPIWITAPLLSDSAANSSILSNTKVNSAADNDFSRKVFVDPKASLELGQKYQDMVRDYELKKPYGLNDPTAEQNHINQVSGFGNEIWNRVSHDQAREGVNKLNKAADNNPGLKEAAKPVAMVGALVAASNGKPMNLKVSDATRVVAQTNVRQKTGSFNLNSPLLNAGMDLTGNAPASWPTPDQGEKYRLHLSRPLGLWDLSSAVSYGSTTNSLDASLHKRISANVSCQFDSVLSLNPEYAASRPAEQTVRLDYGITF